MRRLLKVLSSQFEKTKLGIIVKTALFGGYSSCARLLKMECLLQNLLCKPHQATNMLMDKEEKKIENVVVPYQINTPNYFPHHFGICTNLAYLFVDAKNKRNTQF